MKKFITIFLLVILLVGCSKNEEITRNIFAMDTYIEVKLYENNSTNKDILDNVSKIYDEYNKLCDMYNEYDDIINVYYLNEILKDNEEIIIDSKLSNLISYSIEQYYNTNGYFNPAIGNLTLIWHNYLEENNIPKEVDLSNLESTNIEDITITSNTYKKRDGVKLDLGGICKGYATQTVGEYLEMLGIKSYLINAGGNVKVGMHYQNDKYIIGIQNPNNTDLLTKVYGENISVVTSGDYQRYYEIDGIKYNHIINPKTKYPSSNNKSVTVITNNSSYGDIMSTYLFLLDKEDILDIVNNLSDIEVIGVDKDSNIFKSEGISIYEEE